jgi:hypothetical protein
MITIVYWGFTNEIVLLHVDEKHIIEGNHACYCRHNVEIEYELISRVRHNVSWLKERELDRIKPAI